MHVCTTPFTYNSAKPTTIHFSNMLLNDFLVWLQLRPKAWQTTSGPQKQNKICFEHVVPYRNMFFHAELLFHETCVHPDKKSDSAWKYIHRFSVNNLFSIFLWWLFKQLRKKSSFTLHFFVEILKKNKTCVICYAWSGLEFFIMTGGVNILQAQPRFELGEP